MDDITVGRGEWDGSGGDFCFVQGGDFTNIHDRFSVNGRQMEVGFEARGEMRSKAFNTLEAKPLPEFLNRDRDNLRVG